MSELQYGPNWDFLIYFVQMNQGSLPKQCRSKRLLVATPVLSFSLRGTFKVSQIVYQAICTIAHILYIGLHTAKRLELRIHDYGLMGILVQLFGWIDRLTTHLLIHYFVFWTLPSPPPPDPYSPT
jgi:hypothetical protein